LPAMSGLRMYFSFYCYLFKVTGWERLEI